MKLVFRTMFVLIFIAGNSFAQSTQKKTADEKGRFYFSWGYNKDYFTESDIHFKNHGSDNYDFTLYNVKAMDRPGYDQILKPDIAVPQYVYRLGYYFRNSKHGLGIEINFDHAKYVMKDYQRVHLKGYIHEQYYDTDTLVTPAFLRFEHTNGANFLMVNVIQKHRFHQSKNTQHTLSYIGKLGGGVVIPKTDVTLFGERLDNVFHVAGYIFGTEIGMRYEYKKYFFAEGTVKGVYAKYDNVLTVGTGKADHYFFAGELILTAGVQLPL